MQPVIEYIDANAKRFVDELCDFLRIPSVSADSAHAADVGRAATFVRDQLRRAGLSAQVVKTDGHPLVVGEWLKAAGAPTVLIYGHYDVQPPDPLALWVSGPFEPTIREGRVYARGASDDKGQMFTHVKSVEAWLQAAGVLPVNVKFLIEGEEEVGSTAIEKHLRAFVDRFACDYVVISDCSMYEPNTPAITYGLRGIAYFEVRTAGPSRDLHSGSFGGSVQNPANALCQLLAGLKDAHGRIQIPGFYDDVVDLADGEREAIRRLERETAHYREEMGVKDVFGEAGFGTLERRWIRPTCDINGLYGGYQGEGPKTIIPAGAGAKVSFRLVPNQDPQKIAAAFEKFLRDRCPPGVNLDVHTFHGSPAVVVPLDSPGIRACANALNAAFGRQPVFIREGGTIPIVSTFKEVLGADSLLIGFGLPDDNIHSPNEKFSLADFHRGIRASACLFQELSTIASR
jgi:acetylornithine deacetylase/succinyl-diaminopimelate desuccinylase-like protein